ncbi:EPIDERMAL PATTERNING FACTOR-like protein 1 [Andrographis paniculata]|uniref:EPIDERMAL PATTERNING FACTOR-like protein 1 n=1 Tax=Andrographis paniculata TaxID=175694 RepID=UPI0021E82CDA|nr:EPIDERMAL PATTERNING FACTOR-like protein 1 [Andrographis paniculata]
MAMMANNSSIPSISCNIIIPLILALFFLIVSPSSFSPNPNQFTSHTSKGFVVEGKARLGSAPPSCHNKCNQCRPCAAVQEPTIPGRRRAEPSSLSESPPDVNRCSNYKPLGWKCRCGGRFYNP